jgi:ABC-2 type transport system permease protein
VTTIVARKTLRDQRRALTGWAIGMAGLVVMYSAFYPSVKANASQLNKYMETMPEAFKQMIGRADITSPTGYIQTELFAIMAPLLLLIFAIGAGARATAGEEEAGTLDLLLANPVRRRSVVLEKFGAMVLAAAGIGVVLWATVALFGPVVGLRVSLEKLAAAVASAVLLGIAFGAIALLLGCWRGHRGLAIGVTASLAVATYLLHILSPLVERVQSMQLLSPFYYYISHDPLRTGFSADHAFVLIAITAISLALAVVAFDRRDLAA